MLKNILLVVLVTISFLGCGGGGGSSSSSSVISKAFFIDSSVQGVQYSCGTTSGVTGSNGELEYSGPCDIELKIGNIIIGTLSSELIQDNRLYPADLARVNRSNITNKKVKLIIRILQSLDSNNNPDDGIQISSDTLKLFSNIDEIDIMKDDISKEEIEVLLSNNGFTLISEDEALKHYKKTLLNDLGINSDSLNTPSPTIYSGAAVSESAHLGSIVTTIPISSFVTEEIDSITVTGVGYENFDVSNTGVVSLSNVANLSYIEKSLYTLDVVITDINDQMYVAKLEVTIEEDTTPEVDNSITISNTTSVSVDENQTSALTISASSDLAIKTYSISGVDSSYFNVDSSTGVVTFKLAPDYETKTSYTITLKATNSEDVSASKEVTININDLDDVTLIFDPIDTTEAISTYEITNNPPEDALTINNKPQVKIGFYSSALKSYSRNVIYNLSNYYMESGYDVTFYGTSGTTERLTTFSSDASLEKIEDLDLLVIMQPGQEFNDDEIQLLSKLLDNGGRIFFIGEHNGYSPTENANISTAVVALGGGVTVLGGSYDDDNNQINSGVNKNLNYSVLVSGVSAFTTATYAQLELKGEITQAIMVDDSNRIIMAEQGVSKGRITLIADLNWFDNSRLNSTDNTVFLENLAISSFIHRDFVDNNGNPNTQAVDYLKFQLSDEADLPLISNESIVRVDENQTSALTISATGTSTITYSIIGTDSSYFDVNSTSGVVTFKEAPDYETKNSYSISLVATDSLGNASSRVVTIYINNLSEVAPDTTAPVITNTSTASVDENQTSALTISATDSSTVIYSITGTDSTYFNVNSTTGVVTFKVAPDYETKNSYSITLVATDSQKNSSSKNVTININDINESAIKPLLTAKFLASDGDDYDSFGQVIDMSKDYIAVGVTDDETNGSNSGAVYVYRKYSDGSVKELAKLTANDGAQSDYFGSSVAISGNYIIVGAPYDDGTDKLDNGSVYVFKNDGNDNFSQIEKLTALDGGAGDNFGSKVAIDEKNIVIGASGDYDQQDGTYSGSVYIFENDGSDNFTQTVKLTLNNNQGQFGNKIAIDNQYIAINAGVDNHIFKYLGNGDYTKLSTITLPNNNFYSSSYSIDISGDYLAMGIGGDIETNTSEGVVFVYKNDGNDNFTMIEQLSLSTDLRASYYFGSTLSIDGDYLVVGAYGDDTYGYNSGSSYIYKNDGNDNFNEIKVLTAYDAASNDNFGEKVVIDGNSIVVGSPGDGENGSSSGSAYLFDITAEDKPYILNMDNSPTVMENSTYLVTLISNSQAPTYTLSGMDSSLFSVDSSGALSFDDAPDYENPSDYDGDNIYEIDIEITSGTLSNTYSVSISIENNSIEKTAKVIPSDGAEFDHFGSSVASDGDYFVVGAPFDDDNGSASGSVYVYKKQIDGSLSEISKLMASDGASNDNFGESVSISGDYIVIGAAADDDNGGDSGSAYVFKNDGNDNFTQVSKLIASDGASNDNFGESVSISGDYIVIGAKYDDDNGSASGSAYVFKNDGSDNFTQVSKLIASDGASIDYFGGSVSISGDYIVIGANADDDNGSASGSAYVFKNDGNDNFKQVSKLIASDGDNGDYFGRSVSISGDYIVVGSPRNDDNGYRSGSIYLFKNDGNDDFTQVSKLMASDGDNNDEFGEKVSISGDYILIGAQQDDDNGGDSGSAYIFEIEEDKLNIVGP